MASLVKINKTFEENKYLNLASSRFTNNRKHKKYASFFCFHFVGNHCNLNGRHSNFKSNMEVNKDSIWAHIHSSISCEAVSQCAENTAI